MKFKIYLSFGQYLVFYKFHIFLFWSCYFLLILYIPSSVKAMVGHNINEVREGDFPYIVSIMKIEPGNPHSGGRHFCNGVLITRRDVLTCEHCVEAHVISTVQLLIGTIDIRNGSVFHPVWWQTHDQWATIRHEPIDFDLNDIANVRLLEKVPSRLNPVKLSSLASSEMYGANVTTAGWGRNNEGVRSVIMEKAHLQVLTTIECERRIERLSREKTPIGIKILCTAAKPYTLLDFGNSGGPLIFGNRLLAINLGTSPEMANKTHHKKQVNIHLGIHYFRTFINYMKS